MNHVMHKPLFGNEESLKSVQESRNQAQKLKIPESRRRKFRVVDPSIMADIVMGLINRRRSNAIT